MRHSARNTSRAFKKKTMPKEETNKTKPTVMCRIEENRFDVILLLANDSFFGKAPLKILTVKLTDVFNQVYKENSISVIRFSILKIN